MAIGQGLPVARVVNVTVSLTTQPTQAPSINTCLILGTTDGVIDGVTRMREYQDIAEVAADYSTTDEEYLAAVPWFSQNPSPMTLFIGFWAKNASHGQLFGATLPTASQLLSFWNAVTNGGFSITINGGAATSVTGINLSSQTNLNGVASAINTALAGSAVSATMLWNAQFHRFELTSASTGSNSAVAFLTAPVSGTDISGMLGMTTATSGAYASPGLAPETALAAVTKFDIEFSTVWYALEVPSASDADHEAIGAYIEAANPGHYYGVTTSEAGTLVPTDQTNIAYQLSTLGLRKSCVQYSSSNPYAVGSYLARILTTRWNGQNTTLTMKFKQEPGIAPEVINTSQANALKGFNCNVLATYVNGARFTQEGVSCSGDFTDTIIGADALGLQMQTNIFNVLYTSLKVPQTDQGVSLLLTAGDASCVAFVANGYIAPGTWNANGFGTLNQGDFMAKGWYSFAQPIALQSQADRATRHSPLLQYAVKLAGAVHDADVLISVNP